MSCSLPSSNPEIVEINRLAQAMPAGDRYRLLSFAQALCQQRQQAKQRRSPEIEGWRVGEY